MVEEVIKEVEHFTYLGSVGDTQGATEADVKARNGKERVAFLQLKNIWKSKVPSLKKTRSRSGFSIHMSRMFVLIHIAETRRRRTTLTTI